MSKKVIERLKAVFGARIVETSDFRGDEEARVAPADWKEVATFLRDDAQLAMSQFIDLTAVDWPEREPEEPRFDVAVRCGAMLGISVFATFQGATGWRSRREARQRPESMARAAGLIIGASRERRRVREAVGIDVRRPQRNGHEFAVRGAVELDGKPPAFRIDAGHRGPPVGPF